MGHYRTLRGGLVDESNSETYSETTSAIAHAADVLPDTVRLYADMGLLEHVRLKSGIRLLKPSAAERVREIYSQRMGNRGRRSATVNVR
jgi:hypothetical protein